MANGDLERKYWARAWAKAITGGWHNPSDPSFKVKLETDPLLAYRQIQGTIRRASSSSCDPQHRVL